MTVEEREPMRYLVLAASLRAGPLHDRLHDRLESRGARTTVGGIHHG